MDEPALPVHACHITCVCRRIVYNIHTWCELEGTSWSIFIILIDYTYIYTLNKDGSWHAMLVRKCLKWAIIHWRTFRSLISWYRHIIVTCTQHHRIRTTNQQQQQRAGMNICWDNREWDSNCLAELYLEIGLIPTKASSSCPILTHIHNY